nr:acetate--CoA ligase family protein [Streptomyces sp. TRM64462]
MLGSTHGTFTSDVHARMAAACGRASSAGGCLDVSGRPLRAPVPDLDPLFPRRDGPGGPGGPGVAVVTRSADQARALHALGDVGVRLTHEITVEETEEEAEAHRPAPTTADAIAYLAEQPGVGAIACHVEGVRDGRGFLLAVDHAARRGVPVVALVTGGRTPVMDAALRQFGVVRVDAPDQLQDTATFLARARRPTPGAGTVAVHAPYAAGAGTHLAELARAAGLNATHRADALDSLLTDPAVAVLICPVPAPDPPRTDRLARDLVAAAEATDKPVCVVWGSPSGTEPAYRTTLLGSPRVTTFRTAGNCVAAVRAYLNHHTFTTAYRSPFDEAPRTPSPSLRKAHALLEPAVPGGPGGRLSEHTAKQLLRAYGIRVPRQQLVTSAAAAVRAAAQVGYPVVLKASAPRKPERGAVRAGLTSASQVRDTYRHLTETARYEGIALDGVLVCQLVPRGVELAVRITHDAVFGPVVTVGLGGDLECLRDTAVRIPPFGEPDARAMLGELRARALLNGPRGGPPLDVDALVEVLLRAQRMALELSDDLTTLTIDPLVVLDRGQGAIALDTVAVHGRPGLPTGPTPAFPR